MQLSNTFEVKRPVAAVWEAFGDVASVAQCLPGADLTADKGDGVYEGLVEMKLGPMTAKFEGEATVTRDDASNTGHIEGKGVDRRGGSRGQVKVDYTVAATQGGATVTVDADISLSGAIAQFGRSGLVEEITKRLIDEFVQCLEAKMAAGTVEEAAAIEAGEVKGFSLFLSGLIAWISKFFKRLFKRGDE
jgi:carbon-monoxide dehydrogenase small subunit